MNTYIRIPNTIQSFNNTESRIAKTISGRSVYVLEGEIENPCTEYCFNCNCVMHIHSRQTRSLRHIPFGNTLTELRFIQNRYFCQHCHVTRNQLIPFKAKEHFITTELESYAGKLLAFGLTNKEVSEITGLNKNIIKAIDLKRLKDLYTIDEEWMDGVEAVACDMNSDFQEAFEEKCQHVQVVFDYFHIIKNFNDKVISEIRKDEQGKVIEKSGKIFRRNEVVRKTGYVDLYDKIRSDPD